VNTYPNLVDLAESGDAEARLANRGGVWRLAEVAGAPGHVVYSSKSTTWCYAPGDLLHDAALRRSIRMTAEMREAAGDPQRWAAFRARWQPAPEGVRAADALDHPHDDPCPRCGRRRWTDEEHPRTCQACGYAW
jgi:hypothetical protein